MLIKPPDEPVAVVCIVAHLRAFYIKMQKPGGRLQTILFFIAQAQIVFIITRKSMIAKFCLVC
jgi:hypothetical protein